MAWFHVFIGSNNTNKLSPQEHSEVQGKELWVQIIQINLVLKNHTIVLHLVAMFK